MDNCIKFVLLFASGFVFSKQDEILCSENTYPWRKAMNECLQSGGIPVGRNFPLNDIKFIQNTTIWIANYLQNDQYNSRYLDNLETEHMSCGYKVLNKSYYFGETMYGPCDNEHSFLNLISDFFNPTVMNSNWTFAMPRYVKMETSLLTYLLKTLNGTQGKYWTNKFQINYSTIPQAPSRCGLYSRTDNVTYTEDCQSEWPVLCSFANEPPGGNFSKTCFVEESITQLYDTQESSTIVVFTILGTGLGLLLLLLLLAIIFWLKRKRYYLQQKIFSTVCNPSYLKHPTPVEDDVTENHEAVEYAAITPKAQPLHSPDEVEIPQESESSTYDDPVSLGQGPLSHNDDVVHITSAVKLKEGKYANTQTECAYTNPAEKVWVDSVLTKDEHCQYCNIRANNESNNISEGFYSPQEPNAKTHVAKSHEQFAGVFENEYDTTISNLPYIATGNVYNSLQEVTAEEDNYNVCALKPKQPLHSINFLVVNKSP